MIELTRGSYWWPVVHKGAYDLLKQTVVDKNKYFEIFVGIQSGKCNTGQEVELNSGLMHCHFWELDSINVLQS